MLGKAADERPLDAARQRIEPFGATLDAMADRRGLETAGCAFEACAAYSSRAAEAVAGAPFERFKPVACACQADIEQARGEARRDADVACVMRLRVGGQGAAEADGRRVDALTVMRHERARARQSSCNLGEARVAALNAGLQRAIEAMGDGVEALARERGKILGAR